MISEAQFAGNLGLAILLGALVGLEREVRGHDAGIKTNSLVSGGAAVFMMLSVMFTDGGRIAAQVVTGIGFLGAGNIMRAGDRVKGLTTAATLWVVAGVGMVAGTGHTVMALTATGGVLAVNLLLLPLEKHLTKLGRPAAPDQPPADTRQSLLP
ncbi:MAG TPA: MgtC/SapB family protein [Bryobacteraceae bacterium]|nr:MgtC/SapB family protein [Bryobacteraceae bacterium]